MDMLKGEQIAAAHLTDWRKLAQGLHARYVVDDFDTAAQFVVAVGKAGDALGHHPRVSIGSGYVDLKLITDDAIYRDDEGTEHVVEWVTQQDVDLARRITEIAADHSLAADPASVSHIELGVDTSRSTTIAPVWAALLTGS
ncbi:MAG: 4a-hydroxytetrahydrobiopterin dehydratase, partial [Actinomycetota bacterium]|nr:4a-hydroxytetrahydrobiopterin dehydratase [Actinomycetota bacterium]